MAPRLVVLAARPALTVVAAMLHDPDRRVSPAAVAEVERFLTDGARSPLYGGDGDQARTAAESLVERLADA